MAHAKNHDYHILPPSILPFMSAIGAFTMLSGAVLWFKNPSLPWIFFIGLAIVLYSMFEWWSAMVHEGAEGDHTPVVQIGLRLGMMMFIISEIFFFAAWFWSFFKNALFPEAGINFTWPPEGIEPFDPWHLPLINTLILLLSGTFVTAAHYELSHGTSNREEMNQKVARLLMFAVILGMIFTFFQAYEYSHATFGLSGNLYGANFFMATGFHGLHVIIGTIFLFVCMIRARAGHFTRENHLGFEAAAWYWHFVDVVWLFLFAVIYVWGS